MKYLLNTLYVTTQGAYLAQEGETVLVRVEHETRLRVPIHTLGGIVCFGLVSCSAPLMGLCGERGVTISFLTEYGRFRASVHGPVSGNVLLRRTQYRRADSPEHSAELARTVVIAKVANSRTVLLRAAREREDDGPAKEIREAAGHLAALLKTLERTAPLDTVRGIEGDAAGWYFSVFDHLITMQKDAFFFRTRSRRPPLDNVNALLSFVYTLLVHDTRSALENRRARSGRRVSAPRPARKALTGAGPGGGTAPRHRRPPRAHAHQPAAGKAARLHPDGHRRGDHGRHHAEGTARDLSDAQTGGD